MPETEWDVMTLYDLLTYTERHLGDFDEGTLGAGNHHLVDIVVLLEVLLCVLAWSLKVSVFRGPGMLMKTVF